LHRLGAEAEAMTVLEAGLEGADAPVMAEARTWLAELGYELEEIPG
jgi:hypothetical protein